ncbi:DUF928 domain-containing protein [Microcoleus sp. herbarium2]|uniref:DUF928 domain-containing protein n=1 Tax=Microcoleus sp. herbarium2 TaxID=3055433 RepID=UPI002FD5D4C7
MKRITKFILNLTSIGSIVLIATLNASQLAVIGQQIPPVQDGKPTTVSGGPRFIQPAEDIEDAPTGVQPDRGTTILRGKCEEFAQASVTALVPENKIGRTVSDYPTFFFYLPQPNAELAEFILEDENGNLIYEQALTIKNLSGVIGVSIPANTNVPPLEVGKKYTWVFSLVCDPEDRSADKVEKGSVRRVELSANILGELENADPRRKTFIYAENGIWQDALSNLAAARRANPNELVLQTDWESLLGSVTLGEIAKEPIVEMQAQPQPQP